jgi:asparagine synthase (glutamine-hydrolysing)
LFNWFCPTDKIHETTLEYLKNIHYYDGLRCDRTISDHGLEARIPFSDILFIKEYLKIPENKRHPYYGNIEKYFLRQAFYGTNLLPDDILFRRKEAFSDGVSSKENSLFTIIQNHCDIKYKNIKHNEVSNEAYHYKQIFIKNFGYENLNIIPGYWKHKYTKDGLLDKDKYHDPSARTLCV